MNYKKIIVKKYKAISGVEINLKNNLIPIIGINESGKSSLLHSLLAFDFYNDENLNGNHLDAKNRYDYEAENHIITAHIEIGSQDDINTLQKKLKFAKSNKTLTQIQKLFDGNFPIILSRNLDDKQYHFDNIKTDASTTEKLIKQLFLQLPYILLFDDFTDRVPDRIVFSNNYLNDDYDEADDTYFNEWNSFIEEIFDRATKDTLKSFLNNKSKNDRDGILSDVNDTLNEDIIQNWRKLKVLRTELANEKINDLQLSLDYLSEPDQHIFIFKVIDKNFKGKGRFFSVTERSKGFQWFFNFAIKLKYNPKYLEEYTDAIYLLDEPGSYLHSSAQEELLKSLKDISKTNKVIYCTHSQYLLNPDIINLSNIKIAVRDQGYVKFQNFSEYKETNKSQGSLSPLYHALHLNIAKHSFPRNENVIITEGIVDYYIIKLGQFYLKLFGKNKIEVIPGAGATNLKDLISLGIAWSQNYTLLLDSDDAGKDAYERYKLFFGEAESKKWTLHSLQNKKSNVKIEDLFSKQDQTSLLKITNSTDFKRAIMILFYSNDSEKSRYFKNLSSITLDNFQFFEGLIIKRLFSTLDFS